MSSVLVVKLLFLLVAVLAGFRLSNTRYHRSLVRIVPFLGLLLLVLVTSACTAQWLSALSAMLPGLITVVESLAAFVAALEGKTLSSSFVAKVKQIAAGVATEITNAQTILAAYKANPSNSLLANLSAVFSAIVTNLQSILVGLNITDTATQSKLMQLVGLAVGAVQAVLGLIPLVQTAMETAPHMSALQLEHADAKGAARIKDMDKDLREAYGLFRTEPSGSVVVDAAVATLPAALA